METKSIVPLTKIRQALLAAETPEQSRDVEAMAAAAKAWAKENDDYELEVGAEKEYILARRHTTELIEPIIIHGDHGKNQYSAVRGINVDTSHSELIDYGFTKLQWERRKKELEVTEDDINDYMDDCTKKRSEPTTYGLLRFCSVPHVSYNSGNNEWYTPAEYIDAARRVMGEIDLDPASSDVANKVIGANVYYTAEENGLLFSWGGRVWMNPPYAAELIGKFTEKLAGHYKDGDITEAVVLVNNATETQWFYDLVSVASAIIFTRGRVKFWQPGGNTGAPLQGQAVIYLGEKPDLFLGEFADLGWGCLL